MARVDWYFIIAIWPPLCVHEGICQHRTPLANQVVREHPPHVVEVVHDLLEAVVLPAHQVLDGHPHVTEDDEGCDTARGVGGLHLFGLHAFLALPGA